MSRDARRELSESGGMAGREGSGGAYLRPRHLREEIERRGPFRPVGIHGYWRGLLDGIGRRPFFGGRLPGGINQIKLKHLRLEPTRLPSAHSQNATGLQVQMALPGYKRGREGETMDHETGSCKEAERERSATNAAFQQQPQKEQLKAKAAAGRHRRPLRRSGSAWNEDEKLPFPTMSKLLLGRLLGIVDICSISPAPSYIIGTNSRKPKPSC